MVNIHNENHSLGETNSLRRIATRSETTFGLYISLKGNTMLTTRDGLLSTEFILNSFKRFRFTAHDRKS